ncbi:MAG: TlpA family protein disulfide reductase [Akkermansia sp.]|nr:TlpA family protein disulfide reductase [Akkermansia sp.]
MKKILPTLLTLVATVGWSLAPAVADETAPAAEPAAMSPVTTALDSMGYFTETKALPKADYYIFIASASWCGPCRALMPLIVQEYKKNISQDKSVSLVLLCYDRDAAAAKKYIGHYNCDMPGVMGHQAYKLPNCPTISYIPSAFILKADGELVASGRGSLVLDWKKLIQGCSAK